MRVMGNHRQVPRNGEIPRDAFPKPVEAAVTAVTMVRPTARQ
jgi:hypothetical protein